jgi:protein SCO1/2
LVVWGLSLLAPIARAQNLSPAQMQAVSFEQKPGTQLPLDLPFTDETGRHASFGQWLGGRPTVLVFAYHGCPSLCSVVLGSLVESLRNLRLQVGRDFDVTVVSIDPTETTAAAANGKQLYAHRYGRYGSESGWHFLTGPQASIDGLANAAGFHYVKDPVSGQYAHASGIAVLTPAGRVSRYFLGVEYPPHELQAALTAAGRETIGERMQQILLLCFHYAPITGRYGRLIQFGIRAAGLATVAGLGLGLFTLSRRRTP